MAPRNVSKQQAEQADTGEDSESEREALDPKAISRDMEKNTHARKTQKRNQLSAKYQQEISSLEQQVASMTGSAAKQLADTRHDQQQRLHELVRRRAEIEDQIVQHSQILGRAYDAAYKEMNAAVRGRLEDLQSNNEGDEEMGGPARGVDERQVADKGTVKNTEKLAKGRGVRTEYYKAF